MLGLKTLANAANMKGTRQEAVDDMQKVHLNLNNYEYFARCEVIDTDNKTWIECTVLIHKDNGHVVLQSSPNEIDGHMDYEGVPCDGVNSNYYSCEDKDGKFILKDGDNKIIKCRNFSKINSPSPGGSPSAAPAPVSASASAPASAPVSAPVSAPASASASAPASAPVSAPASAPAIPNEKEVIDMTESDDNHTVDTFSDTLNKLKESVKRKRDEYENNEKQFNLIKTQNKKLKKMKAAIVKMNQDEIKTLNESKAMLIEMKESLKQLHELKDLNSKMNEELKEITDKINTN